MKAHYEKHVLKQNEFGDITQNEYLRLAKEFATEEGSNFVETEVSNILIKYDSATRRVFIGNAKTREIRSFYIAGEDVADPLQQAIDIAMDKTTN